MRYVIYARKSSESEERQILSIEAQLAELQEHSAKEKLKIVGGRGGAPLFPPPHPSRAPRGEGRIPFELFPKGTARKDFASASCPPRFARRLICIGFLAKKKRIYQTKYGSSRFVLEMLLFLTYPHSAPVLSRY